MEGEAVTADYTWTVALTGASHLTERGWDVFADAVDSIDAEGLLHDAIVDALDRALPKDPTGDERHDAPPPMDWYDITVTGPA